GRALVTSILRGVSLMGTASFSKKWVAYDTGAAAVFHPVFFAVCGAGFVRVLTAIPGTAPLE
ncbi:hypothetical protein, partial [uncultured Alcanivorax sp.]|uniref:hypothetical protein n=1 Tax=uncultured Alcanivorax sp. TaxID=191215 RepID=UPI00262DD5EE